MGVREIENTFDVCLIGSSDIQTDARLQNFAQTYSDFGKKVCVIAPIDEGDKFVPQNYVFIAIYTPKFNRAMKKSAFLNRKIIGNLKNIQSEFYIASDLFVLPAARYLSKINGGEFIYDSREVYSAAAPLSGKRFKQWIQTRLEKRYVKFVDKFVVTGERDKVILSKIFGDEKPFYVVKNYPKYKKPIESNILREKLSINENDKILIYQGMVMKGRGLDLAIEAIANLENFALCVLGEGDYIKTLRDRARKLGLENKTFFWGTVPYNELHAWTCSADIGLALIEPISLSYELALPNKLFEYCQAGLPSLATDLPAMKEVIDNYGVGAYVDRNATFGQIAEAIKSIAQKENYSKIKEICLKSAKEFSFEGQKKELLRLLGN